MATSKATPGPWTIIETCKGIRPDRMVRSDEGRDLAHCIGRNAEADAALISAAPDLRDALREVLTAVDAVVFRPPVDDSRKIDQDTRALRAVLENARAALAKAGE